MKIEVTQTKRTEVRLGDLKYGDGFLDLGGFPYIVLNPNSSHFEIQTASALEVPVLFLHEKAGTLVLGHLNEETEVRPADVKITLTERGGVL